MKSGAAGGLGSDLFFAKSIKRTNAQAAAMGMSAHVILPLKTPTGMTAATEIHARMQKIILRCFIKTSQGKV